MKKLAIFNSMLSACLALSLAGCGGGNEPPAQQSSSPEAPGVSSSPASEQANAPASEEATDIVEINIVAPLFSDPPDMGNEYWTEYMRLTRSKLNVEWVDPGNFHTVYNLRLASNDIPEVSGVPDIRTLPLIDAIKGGAFWDLTDYLGDFSNYPNLRDNVAPNCYSYLSVDGRIYATPRSRSRIDLGIALRQDWVEALGLTMPTTLDEYADVLEAIIKADPDGNGQVDTIGLICANSSSSKLPPSLGAGFGIYKPQYDEEGGQYPPQLNDAYQEYVAWCRELYARGILDREYMSTKYETGFDMFSTNRGASYINSIWHHYEWEQGSAQVQSDPVPKVTSVLLEGPHGDYAVQLNTGVSGGYYVSSKVPEEKMKRILQYFEDATSQEVTQLAYYGIEGIHYDLVDGTPVLNKLGIAQINTSGKCVGPLAYSKWGKVDSAGGSKAFNEQKRKEVEKYDEVGTIDYWGNGTLLSNSWSETWPKFQDEFNAMEAKAVTGQISLDEFKAYVETLRQNADLKKSFQEFAASYEDLMKVQNG